MDIIRIKIDLKSYGQTAILQNINQPYKKEQIHGILGANGTGKTTLFRCMSGQISFNGEQVFSHTSRIGVLPAELFMYPKLTGKEFVVFCLKARGIPIDYKNINLLSEQFELPLDRYGEYYSTGMLKKLYLMSLILQKNDVLILDEPFNGLDYVSTIFVTEWIKQLKNQGTTIFVSSHNIEHLISFCDSLSLLQNGKLDFYDDPASFIQISENISCQAQQKIALFFNN